VTQTGAVVDAAVAAGAASVDGPSFFIDDPQALLRRALVAAFRDARSKAAALAAEAGLTLGQAISIRESTFVPAELDFDSGDDGGGGAGAAAWRRQRSQAAPRSSAPSTSYSRPDSAKR
jgi:Protein of unknown function (DUF541)